MLFMRSQWDLVPSDRHGDPSDHHGTPVIIMGTPVTAMGTPVPLFCFSCVSRMLSTSSFPESWSKPLQPRLLLSKSTVSEELSEQISEQASELPQARKGWGRHYLPPPLRPSLP